MVAQGHSSAREALSPATHAPLAEEPHPTVTSQSGPGRRILCHKPPARGQAGESWTSRVCVALLRVSGPWGSALTSPPRAIAAGAVALECRSLVPCAHRPPLCFSGRGGDSLGLRVPQLTPQGAGESVKPGGPFLGRSLGTGRSRGCPGTPGWLLLSPRPLETLRSAFTSWSEEGAGPCPLSPTAPAVTDGTRWDTDTASGVCAGLGAGTGSGTGSCTGRWHRALHRWLAAGACCWFWVYF